jgi:ketosteroid isomerase-like protein
MRSRSHSRDQAEVSGEPVGGLRILCADGIYSLRLASLSLHERVEAAHEGVSALGGWKEEGGYGMTTKDAERLHAKEAIRDCIYRYARGIDRADEEVLLSSYWPDACDSHGATSGPVSDFYERVRRAWANDPRNVHHVTNILIEFREADHAAVESYFLALQRSTGPDGVLCQVMLSGRYCDLFERRGGEWRVARRTVVYDWVEPQAVPAGSEAERFGQRTPIGAAWPEDPVYRIGQD